MRIVELNSAIRIPNLKIMVSGPAVEAEFFSGEADGFHHILNLLIS